MDDIELSVRSIVAQSDVNVVTKRMIRCEYMRKHGLNFLQPHLEKTINQVLQTVVHELSSLLKEGHSTETLNMIMNERMKTKKLNSQKENNPTSTKSGIKGSVYKNRLPVQELLMAEINSQSFASKGRNSHYFTADDVIKILSSDDSLEIADSGDDMSVDSLETDAAPLKNWDTVHDSSSDCESPVPFSHLIINTSVIECSPIANLETVEFSSGKESVLSLEMSSTPERETLPEFSPDIHCASLLNHSPSSECDSSTEKSFPRNPIDCDSNLEVIVIDSSPEIFSSQPSKLIENNSNSNVRKTLFFKDTSNNLIQDLDVSSPNRLNRGRLSTLPDRNLQNRNANTQTLLIDNKAAESSAEPNKKVSSSCERNWLNVFSDLPQNPSHNRLVHDTLFKWDSPVKKKQQPVHIQTSYNQVDSGNSKSISRHRGRLLSVRIKYILPQNSRHIQEIIDITK